MQKNLNIEKIIFNVVQMKFLAMHITNKKISFDIFMIGNVLNILMNIIDKIKIDNFDPYNVFLAIATNIPSDLRLVLCSRDTYHNVGLLIINKPNKHWDSYF